MIILFHLFHFWWRKNFSNLDLKYWDSKLYSFGGSLYCNNELVFDPPCYQQRYAAVAAVIEEEVAVFPIKKIIDFGCAELSFFTSLKRFTSVVDVVAVDIDRELLERYGSKVVPQLSDHLFVNREEPLTVRVCCGSVSEYDPILGDTDVVVAIELIEHLHEETLIQLPHNIFGCIRPRLAILTTPNADFNVLFKKFTGFRHWDHKFEWDRLQFQSWAVNITERYPEYSVKLFGIGPGPQGTEDVGCCSQMAVFRLLDPQLAKLHPPPVISSYELIRKVEYPFFKDIRTREEKICEEVRTRIWDVSRQYANDLQLLPLKDFLPFLRQHSCESLKELSEILKSAQWTVEGTEEEPLVRVPENYYSSSEDLNCFDDYAEEGPTENSSPDSYDEDWDLAWDGLQNNNCQEPNNDAEKQVELEWSDGAFQNDTSESISDNQSVSEKSDSRSWSQNGDLNSPNQEENLLSDSIVLDEKLNQNGDSGIQDHRENTLRHVDIKQSEMSIDFEEKSLKMSSDEKNQIINSDSANFLSDSILNQLDEKWDQNDSSIPSLENQLDDICGETNDCKTPYHSNHVSDENCSGNKNGDSNSPSQVAQELSESFFKQLEMNKKLPANGLSKSLIVESESNGKRFKRKTDDDWTCNRKKMIVEVNKAGPSRLFKTDESDDDESSNSMYSSNGNDTAWKSWDDRDRIEPLQKSGAYNRFKKTLAKSCSLDSCLENINCERAEVQAMYLSMHSRPRTHDISSPGPDSGYPASTSMDLTDHTSGFPASASEDSLSGEEVPPALPPPRIPPLPPPPPVENGDVANNNRDGEGNNVEGVRNPLPPPFAPEAFPPWLLHLLLEPPLLLPDEGVGEGDESDASDSPGPSIN